MKIIYIASSSHSGSTLCDMILSCHSRVLGLGEINMLLDHAHHKKHLDVIDSRLCSCGASLPECPVWKGHIKRWKANPGRTVLENYRDFFAEIKSQYGDDVIISDSSKYESGFRMIMEHLEPLGIRKEDVRMINLTKDARAFVLSQRNVSRLKKKSNLKDYYRHSDWFYLLQWKRAVLNRQKLSEEYNVKTLTLGYEELCLHPETSCRKLCEIAGIEFDPAMLDLKQSKGHVSVGNPMKNDPQKKDRIFYDNRWMSAKGISGKYVLYPDVQRLNREFVYSNTREKGAPARHFNPKA